MSDGERLEFPPLRREDRNRTLALRFLVLQVTRVFRVVGVHGGRGHYENTVTTRVMRYSLKTHLSEKRNLTPLSL